MPVFLSLHTIAAQRGDGLHPALLRAMSCHALRGTWAARSGSKPESNRIERPVAVTLPFRGKGHEAMTYGRVVYTEKLRRG